MIKNVSERYNLTLNLDDYFFKCCCIFVFQSVIIFIIMSGVFEGEDGLEYVEPSPKIVILRLLTCYLFHLGNYSDVADGTRKLKFLTNNADKFHRGYIFPAFLCSQF